jgi:hypothetical protein
VEGKELIADDELVVKKKNEVFERPKFASFTPVTP